ncbi:MAG: AMP-dependent synthetase/ligase [Treponema sp.]
MKSRTELPWTFLDEFRGTDFKGEWPTVPEMFGISCRRFPARPCFTVFEPDRITLTYAETLDCVKRLSNWMLSQGIQKGDKIAVSGKNSPEWAVVYLAALFSGAVIVPIDYGLHNEEIDNLLAASKPRIFFVDEEKIAYFDKNPSGAAIYSLSCKDSLRYVFSLVSENNFTAEMPACDDLAAILFTSGTTGNPKGVMLTHKNLVSDCYIAQTRMKLYPTDVFYALLPIHHAYTMLAVFIEAISVGAELVFAKSMVVKKMMQELKEGRITMLLGVPLLFNKLMAGIIKGIKAKGIVIYTFIRALMGLSYLIKKIFKVNPGKKMFGTLLRQANIGTLRIAICGGGPLTPSVFKKYNELGIDFVQGYGLTETSPIITLNPVEHFKIESVGQYFFPYMEMRIAEPDEQGVGEVQVKGPMVMKGYYNMPQETADVFTEDGWFKTGDLGRLDGEGYLMLSGRAKNIIVTEGGKNVFPEEIENAFTLFDDIEQITIQGYVENADTKSEAIEALIYPSDALFARFNIKRGDKAASEKVRSVLSEIISRVNKNQPPYAKISKITILEKPLEMTTTKKVKRSYTKK